VERDVGRVGVREDRVGVAAQVARMVEVTDGVSALRYAECVKRNLQKRPTYTKRDLETCGLSQRLCFKYH